MAEAGKYEALLNDLSAVETQAVILADKCRDLMNANSDLEEFANKAKREITVLTQKIVSLEEELENVKMESEGQLSNLLNTKETETLKIKLQNLISRIDYHLSS